MEHHRITNYPTRTLAALVLGLALLAAACDHHREGPAERTGKTIDRAADKTGDAIENAGRKVNRALPGD